jgi:hypothetical protein
LETSTVHLIALLIALLATATGNHQGTQAGTTVSVSSVPGVPAMRPADTVPPHP